MSSKTISKSLLHLYILLLSAKLQVFVLSAKGKRSLINKLNKCGPRIDPCSTPLIVSYQSIYQKFTFVRCFRFDKDLSKRFNPNLSI